MSKCTGLKFRSKSQNYFNKETMSFEHKESLALLKRESCKCDACKTAVIEIEECGSDMIDCVYWRIFSGTTENELKHGDTHNALISWDSDDDSCYVDEINFMKEAR